MIIVYVIVKDKKEGKKIAKHLLEKKLCACVNVFENISSYYFWPEGSNNIEEDSEAVLIIKSKKEKYDQLEKEINEIHSYDVPCIFSLDVDRTSEKYLNWLNKTLK